MIARWKGFRITIACWFLCLLAPAAIPILVMTYGPTTEFRSGDEPIPWPAHAVDVLFIVDFVSTVLLICLVREHRGVVAAVALPLLLLTALMAFWGGLWLSGDWL
jgi:hypothetical protein